MRIVPNHHSSIRAAALRDVPNHQLLVVDVGVMSRIDDLSIEIKNPVDRDPVVLRRQQEGQLLGVVTPRARIFVALFDGVFVYEL